jgi:hypothetical protein
MSQRLVLPSDEREIIVQARREDLSAMYLLATPTGNPWPRIGSKSLPAQGRNRDKFHLLTKDPRVE